MRPELLELSVTTRLLGLGTFRSATSICRAPCPFLSGGRGTLRAGVIADPWPASAGFACAAAALFEGRSAMERSGRSRVGPRPLLILDLNCRSAVASSGRPGRAASASCFAEKGIGAGGGVSLDTTFRRCTFAGGNEFGLPAPSTLAFEGAT
jgi:hypothetical protein